jgi:hypothetical protein
MITQTEINNGFLIAASQYAKEQLRKPSDTTISLTEAMTVWAGLNVEDFTYWDDDSAEHNALEERNGWKHEHGAPVHISRYESGDDFSTDILHTHLHLEGMERRDGYYLQTLAVVKILEHMKTKHHATI